MAQDGVIALEMVRSRLAGGGSAGGGRAPAAVLTDVNMPKLSGIELAEELRQIGFSGPIVAITGDITKSKEDFEAAGFDKILEKPCRPAAILATLASFQLVGSRVSART